MRKLARGFRVASGVAIALGLATARVQHAEAAGTIASPGVETTEARIAISVSAARTTTWSSLRLDGVAGSVAMVVPTLDGSSLDYSSRAFFEALEDATAPRVLPPKEAPAACPGKAPKVAFSIEGDAKGEPAIEPVEVVVLATSADVEAWATQRGLPVDPTFSQGLATFGASYRFVVVRFQAPGGPSVTKTLRAVSPTADPTLPLVLSFAPDKDLHITTWELGAGRGRLSGTEVALGTDNLLFKVSNDTSNYRSLADAILGDPSRHLVEASGHAPLAETTSLFDGSASIDSVIESYFTRASSYGDTLVDPAGCTFHAATILAQNALIGHACPRADLGVLGSGAACVESTQPLGVDPKELRCGAAADDLAVGLSDLVANGAWVTRSVFRVTPTKSGSNVTVGFTADPAVSAVRDAASIDQTGCGGSGPKSTSSSTTSSGSGTGVPSTSGSGATTVNVPIYRHEGCDCGGTYALVGYNSVDDSSGSAPSAYYDNSGDSCASSTPSSTDSSSSYDSTPTDSCASDPSSSSSSTDACSADTSSGSSSSDACSNSSSSDSCSGDTSSSSDSCNCAIHGVPRRGHRLNVRMSALVYALGLVIAPFRRWRRRRGTPRSRS